jgi:hypothetical protein
MSSKKAAGVRFTSGDYYRPPSAQDQRYYFGEAPRYAWVKVIRAIEEIAPAVVKSLAREVFPAYHRAAGWLTPFPLIEPRALESVTLQPNCPAELHTLKHALARWAARWHLDEPGLRARALDTLYSWHFRPAPRGKRQWVIVGPESPRPFSHVADVPFVAKGWHPQTEPQQVAERRILAELRTQVKEHMARVEAIAKNQYGLIKSPIKTQPEHFAWFVRYQVLGESLSDIASLAETDPPTVHRAIDSVGGLLSGPHWPAWKRPPGKSGPRRSRS